MAFVDGNRIRHSNRRAHRLRAPCHWDHEWALRRFGRGYFAADRSFPRADKPSASNLSLGSESQACFIECVQLCPCSRHSLCLYFGK
jgi:hypothetical protein